ncbi:MAG: hypothetical protein HKN19_06315 [Halioglobus sp.]|nr:hypothetical protein [Halioglobus sp.]
MSIGSWDPSLGSQAQETALDSALLARLAAYSRDEQLEQLEDVMSDADKQQWAGVMQIDHDQWRAAVEPLDSAAIGHLIRFLAVAENLPGWEAGAASPVIALAKVLRERGERLDRAQLLWLREVSDNRFLPYGPL